MLRVPDRLEACDVANGAERDAVDAAAALDHRVLEPQLDGIDVQLDRELVNEGLDCPLGRGRRRGAVRLDARLVDHHVPADRAEGVEVVGGGGAHRARAERRARVGAGLVGAFPVHGGDGAVALRADAHAHVGPGGGAGALEHLVAAHVHLDRPVAALPREHGGQGLHVDRGLPAETAADLDRVHADLRDGVAQQLRELVAHAEVRLGADPDVDLAVLAPQRCAVVRLDVALVVHRRVELALEDDVRLGEAGVEVALCELDALRDVGGAVAVLLGALGAEEAEDLLGRDALVDDRRVFRHRVLHVHHRLEHLVLDLDEVEGVLGDVGVVRGDGGHGVAAVERLVGGEDVVEHPARAGGLAFAHEQLGVVLPREVLVRDDRRHARQRRGLRRVDRDNARVRVRAAQHPAVEQPRHPNVRAVDGAPVDLVHSVRPYRAAAHDLVFPFTNNHAVTPCVRHDAPGVVAGCSTLTRPYAAPRAVRQRPLRSLAPVRGGSL